MIAGSLNKEYSGNVIFKNPFKEPIQVEVSLITERDMDKNVFDLLLPKKKVTVPPMSALQIPFGFRPKEINDYFCEVVVFMNEKLSWKYPIKVTRSSSLLLIIVGSH